MLLHVTLITEPFLAKRAHMVPRSVFFRAFFLMLLNVDKLFKAIGTGRPFLVYFFMSHFTIFCNKLSVAPVTRIPDVLVHRLDMFIQGIPENETCTTHVTYKSVFFSAVA
jgi:hypothetical protein